MRRPPILFLGAGFATEAGYASTHDLKLALAHALGEPASYADGTSFDELAGMLQARSGERAVADVLRDLYGHTTRNIPRSYEVIRSCDEFNIIITTNFDVGLCRYLEVDPAFDYDTWIDLDRHVNDRVVLHLHGHAGFLAKTRVITSDDYATFYDQNNNDLLLAELVKLLSSRHLVFVGYGLRDPNIRRVFGIIKQRSLRPETIWVVGPDATDLALNNSHDLGVAVRPIDLKSSDFFSAYERIKESEGSEGRDSGVSAWSFTATRDRARPVLVAIMQYLDDSTLAEDLAIALLEDENRVATTLYLPVAPGQDHLSVQPDYGTTKGEVVGFRCRFRSAEVNVPVVGPIDEIEEAVARLIKLLPKDFSVECARAQVAVRREGV